MGVSVYCVVLSCQLLSEIFTLTLIPIASEWLFSKFQSSRGCFNIHLLVWLFLLVIYKLEDLSITDICLFCI